MTWVKAEYRSVDGTNRTPVYVNLEHVAIVALEEGGKEVRLKCVGSGDARPSFAKAKDVLPIILPLCEPTSTAAAEPAKPAREAQPSPQPSWMAGTRPDPTRPEGPGNWPWSTPPHTEASESR